MRVCTCFSRISDKAQYGQLREPLIKSLSDFATSIMMQDKEKDDANSELFKESFDAVLHNYAAKSDSSI